MRRAVRTILVTLTVAVAGPAVASAADERIPWQDAYANPERRVVRIYLIINPVDMPERVRLRESTRSIAITLLSSALPPNAFVTSLGVAYCVEVRLQRRAGGRRLLDRDRPRPTVGPGRGPSSMAGPRPCQRLPLARR